MRHGTWTIRPHQSERSNNVSKCPVRCCVAFRIFGALALRRGSEPFSVDCSEEWREGVLWLRAGEGVFGVGGVLEGGSGGNRCSGDWLISGATPLRASPDEASAGDSRVTEQLPRASEPS